MSEPHPWKQLFQMIVGYWISQAIYLAAKLRIADHLADGPRSAEELAAAAGVAPRPLYRVLRALAGVGVFAQGADGRFRLNALAEPLREGGPDSLRAFAVMSARSRIAAGATARDRPHRRTGLRPPVRPADLRLPGRAPRAGQDLRRRDDRLQRPGHAGDARRLRLVGRQRLWPTSAAASART